MVDGFTPEPMHYVLTFADDHLAGMSVTVRSVSIRRRIAFNKVRFTMPTTGEEAERYIHDMYAEFCDRLVKWNLTDDGGNAVPPTIDGLMDQHDYVAQAIMAAWIEVVDAQPASQKRDLDQDREPDPTMPGFDPSEIPMQAGEA